MLTEITVEKLNELMKIANEKNLFGSFKPTFYDGKIRNIEINMKLIYNSQVEWLLDFLKTKI